MSNENTPTTKKKRKGPKKTDTTTEEPPVEDEMARLFSIQTGIIHHLQVTDLPVERVTVYNDRAQVVRSINLNIDTVGVQSVFIDGIHHNVLENSFRAEGLGSFFVLDVSYDSNTKVVIPPLVEEEEKDLGPDEVKKREDLKRLEDISVEMKTIELERSRIHNERSWCHDYMSIFTNKQKEMEFVKVDEASQLLTFYRSNLERFDIEIKELDMRQRALEQETIDLRNIINYMPAPIKEPTVITTRRVNVVICPKIEEVITLQFSYIIYGASWSSSYDFRVNYSSDTENACNLVYYGSIVNNTGEDWKNVYAELSTAAPSIGGSPPVLQPVKIDYRIENIYNDVQKNIKKKKKHKKIINKS